ncbi:MAG: hypothetical protein Q8R17_02775 [bacterium]|nr:hypothetical protein [bacterium]
MKTMLLALVALLSVATASAQQKFSSLPIGYNLDGYISAIQIRFSGGGQKLKDTFQYDRVRDGPLETFASAKLRDVVSGFAPKPGEETAYYGWVIDAITDGIGGLLPYYSGESKPSVIAVAYPPDELIPFYLTLRNGKWEVPEEVFGKVRFEWPAAVGYTIPAWNLKVDVSDSQGRIARFAAREGIQDEGNPCALPVILMGLNTGGVLIPEEIATAAPAWWERAEITLLTEDGKFVTFLVNRTEQDGKAIRWSNPPPSFFAPPASPAPKIASLKRVRNTTEITVSAETSATAHLEFSETLNGNWYSIPKYPQPLSLQTGSSKFTHTTDAPASFYRVRISPDRKAVKTKP